MVHPAIDHLLNLCPASGAPAGIVLGGPSQGFNSNCTLIANSEAPSL